MRLPLDRIRSVPKRQSRERLDKVDFLRGEMVAAGARLEQALSAQGRFAYHGPGTSSQRRKRRRTIEFAADEYATAVERWRTALEGEVERHVTQRQKGNGGAIRKVLKSREAT